MRYGSIPWDNEVMAASRDDADAFERVNFHGPDRRPLPPKRQKSAAECLAHAATLGERLGTDVHGLRIPVGVALGPVHDYAYAYVREKPWGTTFASLVVAQIKSKETP